MPPLPWKKAPMSKQTQQRWIGVNLTNEIKPYALRSRDLKQELLNFRRGI